MTLKEVTGSRGWLTQPGPAFGGADPACWRLFIPPLGCSCFLSDLHLNKQIQNVICSQAENLPKFPRELMIHQQQWGGVGSEEEERERNLRLLILISCLASNLGWAVSEASLVS